MSAEVKPRELNAESTNRSAVANRLTNLHQNIKTATRKTVSLPHSAETETEFRSALTFIGAEEYDDWQRVLLILFRLGWGDIGKAIAYEWSKTARNFDEIAFEKKWADCAKASMRDNAVTYRSLLMFARQAGWHPLHQETFEAFALAGDVIDQMNVEYVFVNTQARVYRVKYANYVSNEQFLTQTANIQTKNEDGKTVNAGRMWLTHSRRRKAENVVFEPGKPSITENNEINLWLDPKSEACEGDVGPFTELMQHLLKNEETLINHLLQFFAAPMQHPGLKIHYALLLHSVTQGTGKSLLAETIGRLYGAYHTTITNNELNDNFNDWIKAKQFVIGEEIALGDKRSVMSTIQTYITKSSVQVNVKNQPRVEMRNCANFIFLSNKPDALYLEDTDRRFLVCHVVERSREAEFYKRYVNWLESGGNKHLLYLLLNYDLTGFNAKGHAPMTDDKRELISIGRSEVEQYVRDVIADEGEMTQEFSRRVDNLVHQMVDKAAAIAKVCADIKLKPLRSAAELLSEFNLTLHRRPTNQTALGRALASANVPGLQIAINGKRDKYYAMCDLESWRAKGNEEWRRQITRQNEQRPHIVVANRLSKLPKR